MRNRITPIAERSPWFCRDPWPLEAAERLGVELRALGRCIVLAGLTVAAGLAAVAAALWWGFH